MIDAPGLKPEHYEVFDTAMGQRAIQPMGHVRMMAATQPFLSGAISKTVNLPESATVDEIADVYPQGLEAWASRRWRSTVTTARLASHSAMARPPRQTIRSQR